MTYLQWIGLVECAIIIALAEPTLNRMSPCAPFLLRWAIHAFAIGSVLRAWHLIGGHEPSWSSLVQMGGLALLFICDRMEIIRLGDRRRSNRNAQKSG